MSCSLSNVVAKFNSNGSATSEWTVNSAGYGIDFIDRYGVDWDDDELYTYVCSGCDLESENWEDMAKHLDPSYVLAPKPAHYPKGQTVTIPDSVQQLIRQEA